MQHLFEPIKLNDAITLNNRIIMAPLTRCMADANLVPTDDMVKYYARRADTGLIISEATIIRPDAQGYPNTPGIYTQAQILGWRKVTDAVHQNGGKIFLQLWHTGRVAHHTSMTVIMYLLLQQSVLMARFHACENLNTSHQSLQAERDPRAGCRLSSGSN